MPKQLYDSSGAVWTLVGHATLEPARAGHCFRGKTQSVNRPDCHSDMPHRQELFAQGKDFQLATANLAIVPEVQEKLANEYEPPFSFSHWRESVCGCEQKIARWWSYQCDCFTRWDFCHPTHLQAIALSSMMLTNSSVHGWVERSRAVEGATSKLGLLCTCNISPKDRKILCCQRKRKARCPGPNEARTEGRWMSVQTKRKQREKETERLKPSELIVS